MESIDNVNVESMAYIRSESEFSNARLKAFLETMMSLIKGHSLHLLSFDEVVEKLRLKQSVYLGLQDIPLDNIVGSTGRYEDFTRRFLPRTGGRRDKERWRSIYTLAVTGKGFPPIDVYKIDQAYFVKDGNHRVSVARELNWPTIQAHVTELPSSISLGPETRPEELLIKEECAYFLEQTHLDQSRPEAKNNIDFTELGGYQRLLRHIELHRYLMYQEQEDEGEILLPEAAADWYDQVYFPSILLLQQKGMMKHFPGRSKTDLYLWLVTNQAELCSRYNLERSDMPAAVQEFLESAK